MKNRFILLTLLFTMMLTALGAATLDDHYQKMLSAYAKLNTWQAELKQTNYFKQSDATLNSTGAFYYQKGRISIRYNKPNEQYLLIQEGKITIYDKTSATAVRSKLSSEVQSLNPVEIVKTYWSKSTKTLVKTKGNQVTILLAPKKDTSIKQVRFNLDTKTGLITQLLYLDPQDNSVLINFSKIKTNQKIPVSVWKLPLATGVKIMEF